MYVGAICDVCRSDLRRMYERSAMYVRSDPPVWSSSSSCILLFSAGLFVGRDRDQRISRDEFKYG